MHILAIETSCDETGIALVEAEGGLRKPRFKVSKNLISSQVKIHEPFGGVVPNLAKREHLKNLPLLLSKVESQLSKIDLIAVTVGPGLEPALWTGIEFAKDLAKKLEKPFIGANHMEGHLYSNWLDRKTYPKFPAIALVVSGGHTILLKMDSLTKWRNLGETRDDAAGEAFDKVARLLALPYPGGPQIEKLAKQGNSSAINFPRPMLKDKNYEFSFSGLKTSVLYYLLDRCNLGTSDVQNIANCNLGTSDVQDIAASFQQAVIDVLIGKTIRAAKEFEAESILLCGGVAANKTLRKALQKAAKNIGAKFFAPAMKYNTDNAAMIAASAYIRHLQNKKLRLVAQSNLSL